MKCEDCIYKRGLNYKGDKYGVSCEVNGEFVIHEDNADAFTCENFERMNEPTATTDNVLIILKSGRDIAVYDKSIKCLDDIGKRIKEYCVGADRCFVLFGQFQFCIDEIAMWGYIG